MHPITPPQRPPPLKQALQQPKQWGTTVPISTALPTTDELQSRKVLEAHLKTIPGVYESEEEKAKRAEVLRELNDMVLQWLKGFFVKHKGFTPEMAEKCGGALFPFGSYRLGVHGQGADIDAVVVCNRYVDRADFFAGMTEHLSKQPPGVITNLQPVPDAFVPVIKFYVRGYQTDMSFARLAPESIDPIHFNALDDDHLKNVDDYTQRSLNGTRVADKILQSVPNIEEFRLTLRAVRLWAKCKGVYGNVFGFPGGVAWALMVARVCQLYPNATAASLLPRFFKFWKLWKWPNPVLLDKIVDLKMAFKIWDANTNIKDAQDLCPVITPCYPSMNSTYNVTSTNLALIHQEWISAHEICENYQKRNKDQPFKTDLLDELFSRSDFFIRYRYYVKIEVSANNHKDFLAWQGFAESKIRLLIQRLEPEGYGLLQAPNHRPQGQPPHLPHDLKVHMWPKFYEDPANSETDDGRRNLRWKGYWFMGINYTPSNTNKQVDISAYADDWRLLVIQDDAVYPPRQGTTRFYNAATMFGPTITPVKKTKLPRQVWSKEQRAIIKREIRNLKEMRHGTLKRPISELDPKKKGDGPVDEPTLEMLEQAAAPHNPNPNGDTNTDDQEQGSNNVNTTDTSESTNNTANNVGDNNTNKVDTTNTKKIDNTNTNEVDDSNTNKIDDSNTNKVDDSNTNTDNNTNKVNNTDNDNNKDTNSTDTTTDNNPNNTTTNNTDNTTNNDNNNDNNNTGDNNNKADNENNNTNKNDDSNNTNTNDTTTADNSMETDDALAIFGTEQLNTATTSPTEPDNVQPETPKESTEDAPTPIVADTSEAKQAEVGAAENSDAPPPPENGEASPPEEGAAPITGESASVPPALGGAVDESLEPVLKKPKTEEEEEDVPMAAEE